MSGETAGTGYAVLYCSESTSEWTVCYTPGPSSSAPGQSAMSVKKDNCVEGLGDKWLRTGYASALAIRQRKLCTLLCEITQSLRWFGDVQGKQCLMMRVIVVVRC